MPIVTLEQVSIAFGHLPLLDGVALQIEAHERVSLIGRNGTGKSTLLQIIAGDLEPDSGLVWRQPGVRISRLAQDAPTNHLDIDTITWLETLLADYPGAVLFVTHDRAFLRRLATRIVELDRGRLTSWPGDYSAFLRKKEEWLANEALQQQKFDKR